MNWSEVAEVEVLLEFTHHADNTDISTSGIFSLLASVSGGIVIVMFNNNFKKKIIPV